MEENRFRPVLAPLPHQSPQSPLEIQHNTLEKTTAMMSENNIGITSTIKLETVLVSTAKDDNDDDTNVIASNKPTTAPNKKLSSLLFPTRIVATHTTMPTQPQYHRQKPTTNNATGVRWMGFDPLAWIESLSAEAEKRDCLAMGGKVAAPIRIGGVNLSLKRPVHYKLRCTSKKVQQKTPQKQQSSASLSSVESYSLKEEGVRKRVRPESDEVASSSPKKIESVDTDGPWDLSSLLQDDMHPKALLRSIQSLASTVESMKSTTSPHVKTSYQRIRRFMTSEVSRIKYMHVAKGPNKANKTKQVAMLRSLYTETKAKMEALVQMAQDDAIALAAQSTTNEGAKQNLATYMTSWLRENWTNPYPDDDGLLEIADMCSTTPTVVSNFLINARTRKWRPAIVKAFEMGRPSEYLLEDSLAIFDGKPVRPIYNGAQEPQQESVEDSEDYLAPPNSKRIKTTY